MATPEEPHLPTTETLPMAPLLDISKTETGLGCNCSTFPIVNDVFINLASEELSEDNINIL